MKKSLFVWFCIFSVLFSAVSCNNTQKGSGVVSDSSGMKVEKYQGLEEVRGKRYCEVWIVSGSVNKMMASVYNTLGCNDCPAEKWNRLDKDKLRDSLKAKSVMLNGPRVFVMDKIGYDNPNPLKVNFGGLDMYEMASIPLNLGMIMHGKPKPYKENTVHRSTEFIYLKGTKVYQIVTPAHTYIMQSFSLKGNEEFREEMLDDLAKNIHLPIGWKYEVKTLNEELILKQDKKVKVFVIRDDLQNAYLRIK